MLPTAHERSPQPIFLLLYRVALVLTMHTHRDTHTLPTHPLTACRVALVLEEFVRLLHVCGMPMTDVDVISGQGAVVNEVLLQGE